jgi:hypothetical protein
VVEFNLSEILAPPKAGGPTGGGPLKQLPQQDRGVEDSALVVMVYSLDRIVGILEVNLEGGWAHVPESQGRGARWLWLRVAAALQGGSSSSSSWHDCLALPWLRLQWCNARTQASCNRQASTCTGQVR